MKESPKLYYRGEWWTLGWKTIVTSGKFLNDVGHPETNEATPTFPGPYEQYHPLTPCPPPDEIKKALELVEAVKALYCVNPEDWIFTRMQGFTNEAQMVSRAAMAICRPAPSPAPSEAEEIATRLISRTDALVRKAGGTLYSRQMTAALHAIAEEIAAANGGKP